jgi:hypothetical protein
MSSFFGNQNSNANPFGNNASNANAEVEQIFNDLKQKVSSLPSNFDYTKLRGAVFNIVRVYTKNTSTGKTVYLCDIVSNNVKLEGLSAITLLKGVIDTIKSPYELINSNFKIDEVTFTLDRVTLRKYYECQVTKV